MSLTYFTPIRALGGRARCRADCTVTLPLWCRDARPFPELLVWRPAWGKPRCGCADVEAELSASLSPGLRKEEVICEATSAPKWLTVLEERPGMVDGSAAET